MAGASRLTAGRVIVYKNRSGQERGDPRIIPPLRNRPTVFYSRGQLLYRGGEGGKEKTLPYQNSLEGRRKKVKKGNKGDGERANGQKKRKGKKKRETQQM